MINFKPFQNLYQNINNEPWSSNLGQRLFNVFNAINDYLQQLSITVNNNLPTQLNVLYGTSAQMSKVSATTVPDGSLFIQTDTNNTYQSQKQINADSKWTLLVLSNFGPGAGTYTVGKRLTLGGNDGSITLDAKGRITAITQAT